MLNQHRAIALASDALVARVREATGEALRDWRTHWPLEAEVRDVGAAPGDQPAGATEASHVERDVEAAARLWWPDRLEQALGAAMFGASTRRPSGEGTAARGAREAADALLAALARAWRVGGWDAAPLAPLSRWQAPVQVRLVVEGIEVVAQVPAQRFATAPRRHAAAALAPESSRAAFATLRVPLEVVLGQAELSVVELAGLQCGDVLLLDASLHDPLKVFVAGAPAALHAWLGRDGQRRAVEFVLRPRS